MTASAGGKAFAGGKASAGGKAFAALRDLRLFVVEHSRVAEMPEEAKSAVRALIKEVSEADPLAIGRIMVEEKRKQAARKEVPEKRRMEVEVFLGSLTDSQVKGIGRFQIALAISDSRARLSSPLEWHLLNIL